MTQSQIGVCRPGTEHWPSRPCLVNPHFNLCAALHRWVLWRATRPDFPSRYPFRLPRFYCRLMTGERDRRRVGSPPSPLGGDASLGQRHFVVFRPTYHHSICNMQLVAAGRRPSQRSAMRCQDAHPRMRCAPHGKFPVPCSLFLSALSSHTSRCAILPKEP